MVLMLYYLEIVVADEVALLWSIALFAILSSFGIGSVQCNPNSVGSLLIELAYYRALELLQLY